MCLLDTFAWEDLFGSVTPSLLISKVLSFGVVAGSLVGKMPQVHAIRTARSAKGVSVLSIWMEMFSMGIQFAYNVVRNTALSTYAEVPILFGQILLLALTAAWADGYLGPCVCLSCFGAVLGTTAMAARWVPEPVTLGLYAANTTFGLVVVGPQVIMNWRSHSTGQLSLAVTAMTFGGLTSRLVTTLVEVEDVALRATVAVNWGLTAILMTQFWVYRPVKQAEPAYGEEVVQDLPDEISVESQFDRITSAVSVASIVDCMSKVGSSRCITDLLCDQRLEDRLPNVRTLPAFQVVHSVGSFSTFRQFRRMDSF